MDISVLQYISINEFINQLFVIHNHKNLNLLKEHYVKSGTFEEPNKKFDENGLAYNPEHLKEVGPRICFLPVQLAACYADKKTIKNIDNIVLSNIDVFSVDYYHFLDATGVGNIAYIYCNTKDKFVKDRCFVFLTKLIHHEIEMCGLYEHFKKEPKVIPLNA